MNDDSQFKKPRSIWWQDSSKLVKLMLVIGIAQIALYYISTSAATDELTIPVPQPDTLLYCQAAKQICNGHPYVFSPGNSPSTGTTSHLYPFVLAIPYALGAKGDALLTAGFFLNALFYLFFLVNWGIIANKICESPSSRLFACILMALSGQPAYVAMSQSDMGLFMAISSGAFAALLCKRTSLFCALLVISPWCRPEGVILSVLLPFFIIGKSFVTKEKPDRKIWGIVAIAIFSSAGIFILNYFLTGHAQFTSIYYKGYLKKYAIAVALQLCVQDLCAIAKGIFLGMPSSAPRDLYLLPLLGAIFAWFGIFRRKWNTGNVPAQLWWTTVSLCAIISVAVSGWQNTNADRYFAWFLPLWLIFIAEGIAGIQAIIPGNVKIVPICIFTLFQSMSAIFFVAEINSESVFWNERKKWGKNIDELIDKNKKIGSTTAVSIAYASENRSIVHLGGIYFPELLAKYPITNFETLKHHPEFRYDYVIGTDDDRATTLMTDKQVSKCLSGYKCLEMNWLPADNALRASAVPTNGMAEIDRIDIGFLEDETRCSYKILPTNHHFLIQPFNVTMGAASNEVFEIGRVILGGDSMTIKSIPGRSMSVLMRLTEKAEAETSLGDRPRKTTFDIGFPLEFKIEINGNDIGTFKFVKSENENGFPEILFHIPGNFITTGKTDITILGDRLALAYWFYQ